MIDPEEHFFCIISCLFGQILQRWLQVCTENEHFNDSEAQDAKDLRENNHDQGSNILLKTIDVSVANRCHSCSDEVDRVHIGGPFVLEELLFLTHPLVVESAYVDPRARKHMNHDAEGAGCADESYRIFNLYFFSHESFRE